MTMMHRAKHVFFSVSIFSMVAILSIGSLYGQRGQARERVYFGVSQADAAGGDSRPIKLKTKRARKADLSSLLPYCDLVDVRLEDGETYTRIILPDVEMLNAVGQPEQPMRSDLVRIPAGAQVSLVIDNVSWHEIEGDIELPPVQQPLPDLRYPNGESPDTAMPFEKNIASYNTDAYSNETPMLLGDKVRIRGREYVKVIYQPLSYNPAQKSLRVAYDVEWHLDIVPPEVPEQRRPDKWFGTQDPDLIDVRTEERAESEAPEQSSLMDTGAQPDLVISENEADYLIITPDAFADAVAPLAAWKHRKGYKTYVANLSEVGSTEADIKNYIQNAYDNGTPTSYVLLIGDHEDLPACKIVGHPYHGDTHEWFVDYPYSLVDGNDNFPDLCIARLPGDTTEQITTMVNKSLGYDRTPDGGTWYDDVLLAGQFQDSDGDLSSDRLFMEDLNRVGDFLGPDYGFFGSWNGYSDDDPFDKGYTIHTALQWDSPPTSNLQYGGFHYTGRLTPPNPVPAIWKAFGSGTLTQINEAINNGVAMVFHRDHGYSTGSGWADPHYTYSNVNLLSNGSKLPFVFSLNCVSGRYDGIDKFAESWLRNSNGGAVGFTGAARVSYSGTNDSFLVGLMDSMWDDYSTSPNNYSSVAPYSLSMRPAVALLRAKAYILNVSSKGLLTSQMFNWLGDPELELRTESPMTLAVTHPDSLMVDSSTNFDVTVSRDGSNCEGALVALVSDSVYETAISNSSGVASFSLTPSDIDTINVTVTEQNSIPYEGIITIDVGDAPYIHLPSTSLYQTVASGNDAGSQSFTISNPGDLVLNYTISDDATWLSCSPNSGSVDTETDTIVVNYDTAAMADGTYTATITVSDPNASNNSQNISVIMDVGSTLTVDSPNGGESLVVGDLINIKWRSTGGDGNVKIDLYKGGSLNTTVAANTANDGDYEWGIPFGQAAGTEYRIRITSIDEPGVSDESDADFEIDGVVNVVSIPYSESFETGIGDWNQLDDDDFDWTNRSGITPSGQTGPTAAQDGSYYQYMESSVPNYPAKSADINCLFDLRGTSSPQLSFWYHMYGESMGTLNLEVSEDGNVWDTVFSESGDQGDQWYQANIDLSDYAGSVLSISFRGTTGSNYYSDMAIDNIQIVDTGVQTHTVTFATDGTAGASLTGDTTQVVNHGTDCTAVTANAPAGWSFVNWTKDGGEYSTNAALTVTNVTEAMTLLANFAEDAPVEYTLTVNSGTGDGTYAADTIVPVVADAPVAGQEFDVWTGDTANLADVNSASTTITMPAANAEITATYRALSYTVTFATDGTAGASLTGTTTQVVNHGTDCTAVTANAPAGWSFVNWTKDGVEYSTNAALTVTNVTETMTMVANFAESPNTPPQIEDQAFALDEAAPDGLEIGKVVASDVDGDALTYSITAGNDDGVFAIDAAGGVLSVADNSSIDYDVTPAYTLTVQVSDGEADSSATITVAIADMAAYGILFTVKASDVDSPQGGVMDEFTRRPRITAHYTDPVRGRDSRSNLRIHTRVPSRDGTPVTEVVCEWTRNIPLYDKRALKIANREGTFTSEWLAANPVADLNCTLRVATELADRTRFEDALAKPLLVTSPQITSVENWDGSPIGDVQTESIVVLKGKYFGSRAPSVWLEYLDSRGRIRSQRLRVQRVYDYDDARGRENRSCMDLDSGVSGIRVEMPRRWWKDWTPGTYSLVIDNRTGIDTAEISTAAAVDNTVPEIKPLEVSVEDGERFYLIDVLDNDSDEQSDSVAIEFTDRYTEQGGRILYDRRSGMAKYIPPRDAEAPFSDSFEYTLDDGHSDEADWPDPVTVTVNISNPD